MGSDSHATETRGAAALLADSRIGVNDKVAAAVTRWVGSMRAVYVVLTVFSAYMALAALWEPLRRFDPYPFPFLLFMNNVAQLVLCLVILVGQRVVSAAADRRAVQTYENAEAIFAQVADLQAHLDRHDRALSRGLSLLESSAHPWIEQHRVRHPPLARDQAITRNDRIAAWLTMRLGSVWAFYLAAGTQVVWIALAAAGVQRFDRYPFLFMTFLSTLTQLLFMIVIMVGQDVLGRTADRRSEQTYLDAQAVLHECRRMKERLTAQDLVIDSLTGYAATQVTERLARAVHDAGERVAHQARAHAAMTTGEVPEQAEVLRPWGELLEPERETARLRARDIGEDLAEIGCFMVPAIHPALDADLDDDQVQVLARLEYDRWAEDVDDAPVWDELPDSDRLPHLQAARQIPIVVAQAGFQVLRGTPSGRLAQRRPSHTVNVGVGRRA